MSINAKTINQQILITAIILIATILIFDFSGIDIWLQDYFYRFDSQQWLVDRDNEILKFIFYSGIKKLFILMVLAMLVALIFFRKSRLVKQYRSGLLIVCLSGIAVPALIGGLKAYTNVPCPKNIYHYNGTFPYVTILGSYPDSFRQTEKMECYPAGHAGGGFALLGLFFLFKRKKHKIVAVICVQIIGWSIGGYKMMIGDHFLSHTVVAMLLAWMTVLVVARLVYRFSGMNGDESTGHGA